MISLIRHSLMEQDENEPIEGAAETDETYVGGKPRAVKSRQ